MSKPKIIIAALILGLSLAGAYFIISNFDSFKPNNENTNLGIQENNPVGIQPVTGGSSLNLTDLLAQKLEERIGEQNTDGFQTVDGKTLISAPDPKTITEELLAEAEKNFDPNSLLGKVNESLLKTSSDISRESVLNYFDLFSNIMIDAGKNIPSSINEPEKMNIEDFAEISNVYQEAANKFYALSAPTSVLKFHKKEIELLLTKKNIFEVIANANTDPMTAFLAVDQLLIIDQEFDKLKTDITNFLKTI